MRLINLQLTLLIQHILRIRLQCRSHVGHMDTVTGAGPLKCCIRGSRLTIPGSHKPVGEPRQAGEAARATARRRRAPAPGGA